MKKNTLLFVVGALCLAAAAAVYATGASAVQTAREALAALQEDYSKVQALAYTGFVDLDSEAPAALDGVRYFPVEDEQVKSMEDVRALLDRVYTQSKAAEVLDYCTGTTRVLTERDGRLYRADAYEPGWPIGPEVDAAQWDGDALTVQVTLEWNEPVPGVVTLRQEGGAWKIDGIERAG